MPTIISIVNGTTLAVTLTGLNPYTQYSCYVTANTSVGEGSPSTILTVQTAQSGNIHSIHLLSCREDKYLDLSFYNENALLIHNKTVPRVQIFRSFSSVFNDSVPMTYMFLYLDI